MEGDDSKKVEDKDNGFNLDLSYVTPKVIAMGYPSIGKEAAFRNPRQEVIRFLDHYHKDHYKVYNLCSERSYDPAIFYGRVARFPFDDHNCPRLSAIYDCCKDIDAYLAEDSKNVVAVHCKAGKGRTGLIICCWLQYNNDWPDADSALAFYAAARTHNQKGVTIPSQLRYVRYFGEALKRKNGYTPPPLKTKLLKEIILHNYVVRGEVTWTFSKHGVTMVPSVIRSWKDSGSPLTMTGKNKKEGQDVSFNVFPALPLHGDIKIQCSGKPVNFHGWICTALIEGNNLVFQQNELDKAASDTSNKIYPKGFHVELLFLEHEEMETQNKKSSSVMKDSRKHLEYKFPSLMSL